MFFFIIAPFLALANYKDAAIPPIYPKAGVFDELRSFSAKINSFLIPNYNGSFSGLLVEVKNKFLEETGVIVQWLGKTAAAIKDKARYALDRLAKLEGYMSVKAIFNEIKNSLVRKFYPFSPQ